MITSAEKRVLTWLEKHIWLLAALVLTVLGTYARYCLREYLSNDYKVFLESWYEQIAASGGDLSQQVGNYNIPYQILIALLTHLPVRPFVAYKLLSCTFDVLLAAAGGIMAWRLSDKSTVCGFMAYALIFCSPIVILNSAAWAQCDAIYTFFAVSALAVLLTEDRPLPALLLYGAALAFKLQAIFLLPFLLFFYFIRKNFSLLCFAAVPAMMVLLSMPAIVSGRPLSDVFSIYAQQADTYPALCSSYPSFWNFFGSLSNWDTGIRAFTEQVRPFAIVTCLTIVGLAFCLLLRTQTWRTPCGMVYTAFWSVYACVLFLPSMHERYGYLCEILAILLAVLYPRTGKLCVAMHCVTLCAYGNFLVPDDFLETVDPVLLTAVNMAVFVAYTADFARRAGLLPPRGEEKQTF